MNFITTYSEYILKETLKTNNIDLSIKNISSELNLQSYNFSIIKNENNTFSITLFNFNNMDNVALNLDNLNNLVIDRHGWFPSKMNMENLSGLINELSYNEEYLIDNFKYLRNVTITYEGKFSEEITNIPNKLYHLSIQEYKSKIIKSGIIPKSKSKLSKHLDRIYVCSDIQSCYNLINRMKLHYNKVKTTKSKINDKWIIYEIDISDLKINIYKDPNYDKGFYIIDNIPNKLIKIVDSEI